MRYIAVRVHNELVDLVGDMVEVYLVVDTEFVQGPFAEPWAISRHLNMASAQAAAALLNAQ